MVQVGLRHIKIIEVAPVLIELNIKLKGTLYPMSKRMGGAENAKDLLSSKSCLRDVVVGVSSSEINSIKRYLKAGWRADIVITRSFYESAWLL